MPRPLPDEGWALCHCSRLRTASFIHADRCNHACVYTLLYARAPSSVFVFFQGPNNKPWEDFVSCADEKEFCKSDALLRKNCQKTCGTCTTPSPPSPPSPGGGDSYTVRVCVAASLTATCKLVSCKRACSATSNTIRLDSLQFENKRMNDEEREERLLCLLPPRHFVCDVRTPARTHLPCPFFLGDLLPPFAFNDDCIENIHMHLHLHLRTRTRMFAYTFILPFVLGISGVAGDGTTSRWQQVRRYRRYDRLCELGRHDTPGTYKAHTCVRARLHTYRCSFHTGHHHHHHPPPPL